MTTTAITTTVAVTVEGTTADAATTAAITTAAAIIAATRPFRLAFEARRSARTAGFFVQALDSAARVANQGLSRSSACSIRGVETAKLKRMKR